ncbi:MAG: RNA methyltransferase [Bacteroidia bacterium]|jgi:tRNA (guanosine-2'-O-)-methyltransferase|nr:RNA methyltransferase [Sphingobacteriaceae bacterium]MBP9068058.1 RNA methyltransferase [Bacteroidia bacterium]
MKTIEEKIRLISYLTEFISPRRKERFDEVMAKRINHLQIVVEDLYQAHNASAVLRSCDCFGVQYVHFIENKNAMKVSSEIALGAEGWVSIKKHNGAENNSRACLQKLKDEGFRIVATTPHKNDVTIDQLPVDKKVALVFGTEKEGISQDVMEMADEFVKIPMYGFTESFNISVSAALCMYELTTRIRETVPNCSLSETEKTDIYLDWLMNSIDKSELIVKEYSEKNSK